MATDKDNNLRCSCGRPKYYDASCCEECWNRSRAYDETVQSPHYCRCGKGKYPDASLCEDCWNAQSAWVDR